MTTFGTFYTPTNTNFAASTCVVTWMTPPPKVDDGEGAGVREPRRPLPVDTPSGAAIEAEAD